MTRIFISYAHADGKEVTEEVEKILLSLRAQVERDCRFLELGSIITTEIAARIRESDVFVVVLSEAASMSPWVSAEIGIAFDLRKRIIPLIIEGVAIQDSLLPYLQGRYARTIKLPITKEDFDTLRVEFARVLNQISENNTNDFQDINVQSIIQPQMVPITNNQYLRFWLEFGRSRQLRLPSHWNRYSPFFDYKMGDQPVTNITWDDAQTFCDWSGVRLPLLYEVSKSALTLSSDCCQTVWVDGGIHKEKSTVMPQTGIKKRKQRDFHGPTLGFATAPVPKVELRGFVWVDGCDSLPVIDLPALRVLAESHQVPHTLFTPIARNAGVNVPVSGFRIQAECVTNTEYWKFAQTLALPYPRHWSQDWIPRWNQPFPPRLDDCPVVNISFDQAQAYARWKEGHLLSLTQRQWAVQFHHGKLYPWGNDFVSTNCNSLESDRGEIVRVDEFAQGDSFLGVRQLCGNNWEWVLSPSSKPLLCGGSYSDPCKFWGASCVFQDPHLIPVEPHLIGFRLVRN